MTDHLPECPLTLPTNAYGNCICDRLRACEQRVRESEACLAVCADRNYERGLDAAREAVAACVAEPSAPEGLIYVSDALAAINALREEQK